MILTPRDIAIIQVAATPGSCMKQYAHESGISINCLKSQLQRLRQKLERHGYKIGSVRDLGLFGLTHCINNETEKEYQFHELLDQLGNKGRSEVNRSL